MEAHGSSELCFPELLNKSCRKPMHHWSDAVLLSILLSFISLLTVLLNLLIIISIFHFRQRYFVNEYQLDLSTRFLPDIFLSPCRQLHTPTNLLVLSLAVSDFLVGLLLMPGEMLRKETCWFLGDLMCSLYIYVSYSVTSASVGDMVLISVDRYMAICDPLHYNNRVTVKRVQMCICLCWLCAVFYSSMFIKNDLTHPDRFISCSGECVIIVDYIAGILDLILTFIVPVTLIVVLYSRVFVVAVTQARLMHSQTAAVNHQVSVTFTKKSELKAAKTLGVVIVVFLICFCPYFAVSLAVDNFLSTTFGPYIVYLFHFNSCLNPLIYALFYPWFRKSIKLILTLQILQTDSCEANIF